MKYIRKKNMERGIKKNATIKIILDYKKIAIKKIGV
jgi:hypothetical protein